jgi:predicted P-loop ATPase
MPVTTPNDLERVPAALRERAQWLVWKFEQHDGEKKPRKVPYYVDGGRRVGTQGSDADRGRLVTFEAAVAVSSRYSGLGFAFLPDDGLIGIDLDNVIDPDTGEIQDRAAGIIRACASFTEYSPSGKGVHIYCHGTTKSHKSNEIGVEVFCGRQFFTVTGRQYPDTVDEVTPIGDAVLDRLHQVIDAARARPTASRSTSTERQPAKGGSAPAERDRIESALACVSADIGYNEWLAVGMALYDALGDAVGFQVWDYWSSKGAKYGGSAALTGHWKSFGNRAPGSDAVIFRLATNAGWRPPKALTRPPEPSTGGGASGSGEAAPGPAQDAPAGPEGDDGADDEDFRRDGRNKIQPSLYNTLHVLERDPLWRGVLGFNQFSYRITKRKPMPGQPGGQGEWADIDDVRLQVYLTKTYGFEPKKPTVMDAVLHAAHGLPYHPVREYLEGLRWDGVSRLHRLMADYWGSASTPSAASLRREDPWAGKRLDRYFELVGEKWLTGAVARIFKPGCKLDTMVVFEGGQGDYKSTSIKMLFGEDWFADSKLKIGDKDALANMQGKWAYEMAEMDAHRKADDTEFKQFLTSPVDRVRWHYGKRAEDVPRQSVFVGTTNMHQYGKDETGMRRIWPVEVGLVDLRRIAADRDQLWAEAVTLFRQGSTWWVDKAVTAFSAEEYPELGPPGEGERPVWSEWELFDEQGESRQNVDAWETPILEWIDTNNALPYFTTAQIMGDALELDRARWTPPEQKRVAAILRRLGYRSKKCGSKYKRVNGWVREGDQVPARLETGGDDVPF